jgi:hypothetical protein
MSIAIIFLLPGRDIFAAHQPDSAFRLQMENLVTIPGRLASNHAYCIL